MDYAFEDAALEREIADAAAMADPVACSTALNAAFVKLIQLPAAYRTPEFYGRKLFTPGLDALVPKLAARLGLADRPGVKSNENPCIVATRFYTTGGHTRVAADLLDRLRPTSAPIIHTDMFRELRYRNLMDAPGLCTEMGERATVILRSDTLPELAATLYSTLSALRPTRIFLLCHPMDVAAILACWAFRDVVDFVHHADHVPALGATLPFSGHVDPTFTCHLACRAAGLDAGYAGMAARDAPAQPPARLAGAADGPIRIATCGNPHKYVGTAGGRAWTDYAVAALSRPDTEIVHIGPTRPELEDEIRDALAAAGIDPGRYIFAGFAESLPQALEAHRAQIYLSSFPESGGKSNIEALAAHLPMIVPRAPEPPPLLRFGLPLPRCIHIVEPGQMSAAIDAALALGETLRTPEAQAHLAQELGRFDAWVKDLKAGPAGPEANVGGPPGAGPAGRAP
jgi:hypothetical protein